MTVVPSPTLEPHVHPASQAQICPLSLAGQVVQPVQTGPNSPLLEPWCCEAVPVPYSDPGPTCPRWRHTSLTPSPISRRPLTRACRLPLVPREPGPSCPGNGNCHRPGPISS